MSSHPVTLFTDVSTSFGVGAWFGDLCIQFSWAQLKGLPELESFWAKKEHINVLELFVVYVAAVYWRRTFKNYIINHLGDNVAANTWVNKCRSAMEIAEEITIELTLFQRRNNLKIKSEHIKGVENVEADKLSRV